MVTVDADSGLHGLSVTQRYFFETKGYLVLPDMLSPEQVDEMNAAVDACADQIKHRDWGDARGKLSADSPALVGQHSRGDTGGLMQWPEPHCHPFRRLLSHRRTARIMLDLVGPGFHYSSVDGIIMDAGAEGHTLHGGGGGPGSRPAWTYSCDNGVIECNLITVMYQLADINPGDGGLVCIPGSHKAAFTCPREVATLEATAEFPIDNPYTGSLYEQVQGSSARAYVCRSLARPLAHLLLAGYLRWPPKRAAR
jgi:hypothetical protein